MSDNLNRFLIDVASDPERMVRFEAAPVREAGKAGLNAEERAALLTRDSRQIMNVLAASGFALGEVSNDVPIRA